MADNSKEHLEYLSKLKYQVVDVCNLILREEIELINGVRKIAQAHYQLFGQTIDQDFLPIISFNEQTDDMPIGEQRQKYSEKFLADMDNTYIRFASSAKQEIFESCQKIIKRFASEV